MKTPWKGLGVAIDHSDTVARIMKKAGLEWEVAKAPLSVVTSSGKIKLNSFALVRSDQSTVLSLVYQNWEPVQNKDGIEFFRETARAAGMEISMAGVLSEGKIVWAIAMSNEKVVLANGAVLAPAVLFTLPHQYGQTTSAQVMVIQTDPETGRISTVVMPRSLKFGHKKKIVAEGQALALARDKYFGEMVKKAQALVGKKIDKKKAETFFRKVFPAQARISKPARKAIDLFQGDTSWDLFNAVTFTIDHELGNTRATGLENAWYGVNSKKKLKALEMAMAA